MSPDHSIADLCRTFEVSRNGYYGWLDRQRHPGPRALENAALKNKVAAIFENHEGNDGSPRIQEELASAGQSHGRNRIARLMRQEGLCARQFKRFKVPSTTDSNHNLPVAPNRLAEQDPPQKKN